MPCADRRRVDAGRGVVPDPSSTRAFRRRLQQANISYPQQTTDAVTQTTTGGPVSTARGLDGSYHLAPGRRIWRVPVGWWSAQLANPDGTLTSPYPSLTVTHLPRRFTS